MPKETGHRVHPKDTANPRSPTWSDLSATGQTLAARDFSAIGNNLRTRATEAATSAAKSLENPNIAPEYRKIQERRLSQMTEISGIVSDRPSVGGHTMNKASDKKVDIYRAAGRRAVREAAPGQETIIPHGAAWYLGHADEIRAIHHFTGGEPRPLGYRPSPEDKESPEFRTVSAGASMSPQNSPANEKEALTAMRSGLNQNAPVGIRQDLSAKRRREVGKETGIGKEPTHFADMPVENIRGMLQNKASLETTVDLKAMNKGGTETSVGFDILRGTRSPMSIGKTTGKVNVYRDRTWDALTATDSERAEFHRRLHESIPGNVPYFKQDTLFGKEWEADPYGEARSHRGILDPNQESTQDTWEQEMNQGLTDKISRTVIGTSRSGGDAKRALLGKVLSSDKAVWKFGGGQQYMDTAPGARSITPDEVAHATGAEVTRRSATKITTVARAAGRNVGAGVPPSAVQGADWTERRTSLGKALEDHVAQSKANKIERPLPGGEKVWGFKPTARPVAVSEEYQASLFPEPEPEESPARPVAGPPQGQGSMSSEDVYNATVRRRG